MEKLNDQQQRAVNFSDGPLMIVAGPGTGKTKTLSARIVHLLQTNDSNEILALTFTNKSAADLRERVVKFAGKGILPRITTFHALALELLKKHINRDFSFIDEPTRLRVLRELKKSRELKNLSVRELSLRLSCYKNATPSKRDESIAELAKSYNQTLKDRGLNDFDDLLVQLHELSHSGDVPKFKHVLVDEFQDTSELQYELLKNLMSHNNLCVIGDPLQSIYGFRGASGDIFAKFQTDFPDARTINLTTNYRSATEIVKTSNAIFPNAVQLKSYKDQVGLVQAVDVLNEYSEAAWVVGQIEQAIGGSNFLNANRHHAAGKNDCQFGDFAILYRTHYSAKTLERAMGESGIPYQLAGEDSPYDRAEIQQILKLMKAIHDKTTEIIDPAGSIIISDLRESALKPSELATKLIDKLGIQIDTKQFVNTLVRFDAKTNGLETALRYFDVLAASNFYDPTADAVTLLTIHAAKGLEFDHVFLLATEEGIIPNVRKDSDIDEEKRLFYVAVTRAKSKLDIMHARTRGGKLAEASRFLKDLPIEFTTDPDLQSQAKRIQKRHTKRAQTSLF